jgi:hypothetical protein
VLRAMARDPADRFASVHDLGLGHDRRRRHQAAPQARLQTAIVAAPAASARRHRRVTYSRDSSLRPPTRQPDHGGNSTATETRWGRVVDDRQSRGVAPGVARGVRRPIAVGGSSGAISVGAAGRAADGRARGRGRALGRLEIAVPEQAHGPRPGPPWRTRRVRAALRNTPTPVVVRERALGRSLTVAGHLRWCDQGSPARTGPAAAVHHLSVDGVNDVHGVYGVYGVSVPEVWYRQS